MKYSMMDRPMPEYNWHTDWLNRQGFPRNLFRGGYNGIKLRLFMFIWISDGYYLSTIPT